MAARKTSKRDEIEELLAAPSDRRTRKGTRSWILGHEEKGLILEVVQKYVQMRGTGETQLGFDAFVEKILKPKFGYPYDGSAFRNYVIKYHGGVS